MIPAKRTPSKPTATGIDQVDQRSDALLMEKCRKIYDLRRSREKIFGTPELFADTAWDIMLGLFIEHFNGQRVSRTSAALAGCAPLTTGLRWLAILERNGIVMRAYDPSDRRRIYVTLTDVGLQKMRQVLERI